MSDTADRQRSLDHSLIRALSGHADIDLTDRMLVFIHLPKCAGRTFASLLDTWYVATRAPNAQGCWVRGTLYGQYLGGEKDETLAALKDVDRNAVYLRGHLPVGVFNDFARPPAYVTLLREPGAQVRSMYRFGVQRGGWTDTAPVAELLDHGYLIDNPQTRQLAGLTKADAPCTAETLETAKRNLQDFTFVGRAEQFELSVQTLFSRLGGPGFLFHSRGFGTPLAISDKIADELDALTEFDRQLYDSVPDLAPLSGAPLPSVAVDSTVMSAKDGAPVLMLDERELDAARKLLEDLGHALHHRP